MNSSTKFNHNNDLGFFEKSAFFDWYGATIPVQDLQEIIDKANLFFVGDFRECKPQTPYTNAFQMFCGEDNIFKVSYGGQNDFPYLVASSHNASRVSEFLKINFPNHSVSRFDTAVDFDEEGAWETLVEMGFYLAEKYNLKVNQQGDWREDGRGGKTLYIGSRSSVVYMRIYEKGKEQIQKGVDVDASPNWVRVELEIKPQKKSNKIFAARMKAYEGFGCSKWSKEIPELLSNEKMPRIKLGTIREPESDLDKRLAYMLYQYGNTIEEIVQHRLGGCRDDLGKYLESKTEWALQAVKAAKKI